MTRNLNRFLASDRGESPPIVKLRPNYPRILEALLFLLAQGAERRITLTQYSILKTFFLADRNSLNRFGRPITFDNYTAMKDGPVASFIYNVLKGEPQALKMLGLRELLWVREPAPEVGQNAFKYHSPARAPDLDLLSDSDLELLADSLTIVSSLSFAQVRRLTHEDAAYLAAWRGDASQKAYDMSLGLLFDTPDYEGAERVAFASQHI